MIDAQKLIVEKRNRSELSEFRKRKLLSTSFATNRRYKTFTNPVPTDIQFFTERKRSTKQTASRLLHENRQASRTNRIGTHKIIKLNPHNANFSSRGLKRTPKKKAASGSVGSAHLEQQEGK